MTNKSNQLYNLDIWVYNRIKFFNAQDKPCFESNDSMAKLFGRHKNRVSSSITKLIRNGYVKNTGNKFARALFITKKEINNVGVSYNESSVSKAPLLLTQINNVGVKELTMSVLERNDVGDIIKILIKEYNKDLKKEEKKEEKKKTNLSDEVLSDKKELWLEWLDYKKKKYKESYFNERTEKKAFDMFVSFGGTREYLDFVIMQGWKGFYELRQNKGRQNRILNERNL